MKKFFSRIYKLAILIISKKYYFSICKSQSENQENKFLSHNFSKFENKNFLEIGFHWNQFNCIGLIQKNFRGHLIDGGNKKNIIIMKLINFFHKLQITVTHLFVSKDNILHILPKKLGVLSIDIDGNDYWILSEILKVNQNIEMIIVEYNASFLDKSITVPYDKNFDRHKGHPSGWYHGASLKAFIKLSRKYNYSLVKTIDGINAIFIKNNLLSKFNLKEIDFNNGYQENKLRNKWSNTFAKDQFKKISNLDYIQI